MKFTVPRRHRKAFDTYSEKKLGQNFSKEESQNLLDNIIKAHSESPKSYGTNTGKKEASLELAIIVANQISIEYKNIKVELERGVPKLRTQNR